MTHRFLISHSFRALNYEPHSAKEIVLEGHNAVIKIKTGTGKTFLLSHICDTLKTAVSKTVSVMCPTGIACKSLLP